MLVSFPRRRWCATALIFSAATLLAPVAGAQAQSQQSLADLTQNADQIFVGQCTKKEALIRNSTIITRYTMKPSELLKGKLDPSLGGDVVVEEPGGEMPNKKLPIGIFVPDTAKISPGEEVLLFASKPKESAAMKSVKASRTARLQAKGLSAAPTFDDNAMRIVGMNQGYFTVITNPENGQKIVVSGGTFGMNRAKNSLPNDTTSQTGQLITKALLKKVQQTQLDQTRQKLAGASAPKEIQPFTALEDVKTQIAYNLQKKSK